jgi:hypothetical protein
VKNTSALSARCFGSVLQVPVVVEDQDLELIELAEYPRQAEVTRRGQQLNTSW